MDGSRRRRLAGFFVLITAASSLAFGAKPIPPTCRQGVLEGEVHAGHSYFSPIGNGLALFLQPIASGWIIRIVPAAGPRGEYDYAELATPPYRSVTPLSLSTDFAFRAQDAVGWNPRRFRFAPDREFFDRLLAAYRRLPPDPKAPLPADLTGTLARETGLAAPAEFRILDATLEPGTANQWLAAAAVASHFATTAHTVSPPADGHGTALGRLVWVRFRLSFMVPMNFRLAGGVRSIPAACEAY